MLAVNISICVFVSMLDLSDWGCLSGVLHECLWSVWGFDLGEFWWECVSLDVFENELKELREISLGRLKLHEE